MVLKYVAVGHRSTTFLNILGRPSSTAFTHCLTYSCLAEREEQGSSQHAAGEGAEQEKVRESVWCLRVSLSAPFLHFQR